MNIEQPAMEVDLRQEAFLEDPYPYYDRLRSASGRHWLAHERDIPTNGLWLFSRYADALEIFKESNSISKNLLAVRPPGTATPFDLSVLHRDGADHLRLRRMVADHFSLSTISNLEPRMTVVAEELVQGLRRQGEADLVADFAQQLPIRMLAELMGLPPFDMAALRTWTQDLGDGFDSVLQSPSVRQRQMAAMPKLLELVHGFVEQESAIRQGSLVGDLLEAQMAGRMTRDELVGTVTFFLLAGHETTTAAIANGLWLLLSHPQQWKLLQDEPDLLPGAVEEILRFESPQQRTSFRVVSAPLQVGDFRLEPGQQVGVIIGAANRDEAEFPNADVFDIRRNPNRHLAFGVGIHNCQGKILARAQARIALAAMTRSLPAIELTQDKPAWRKNSFVRAIGRLPVRVR